MQQAQEGGAGAAGKWLVTASVMIPTMIEVLDTSVANVALRHMQGSLAAGQEEITWVLTSYLVANAVVIPMSGWLAKVMGRKRYLMASVALFTVASLLCGMAGSLSTLVLFRILQGIGGGGMQPMSQAILLETFPPHERGLALSVYGMGVIVAPILGPVLGGWLTDNWSWRWIFYINLPIGLLAQFMCWSFVRDPAYQQRWQKGERVDYLGLALLVLGLGSLQIVLDLGQQHDWFGSSFILALSVVAGVCLFTLVFWEWHHENPIVNLRVFKDRSFALGNVVIFFGFFAFFGSIVLLPMFLQELMGYSAFQAGMVLSPGGLITLALMPFVGKLTQRVDARFLLCFGLLASAWSSYYMSGYNLDMGMVTAITGRNLQGVGLAFFFVPLSFLTMAYIPRTEMNNASAVYNLLRNLGGSFGTAFVTTMVARRGQFHHLRLAEHMGYYNQAFTSGVEGVRQYLEGLGMHVQSGVEAMAALYRLMQRQAAALAFLDVFHLQMIIFLCLSGAMWIMRRPPRGKAPDPGAAH
ncbi:drug resistance transporter, EmrB/QacA subfamily [Desulfocurvibacter africanus subsp. africanus str. Walvis Bay]|uniref:Drug resistance transporter, EmrB/QacA subfamily n=2 Tax=Desulfocurvibacter africanus TaxID=873 RepID=F3Z0P1_DESAF|nr:DHA2 family efflux MFS transporter permease subunit [Desulfocurvibacter africanus]EGJ49865.1 drug resistance transporter, EmrB/QacA subfamily [Desulfocurvibacter africanus subsp. africanus str. Walvis Bay]